VFIAMKKWVKQQLICYKLNCNKNHQLLLQKAQAITKKCVYNILKKCKHYGKIMRKHTTCGKTLQHLLRAFTTNA
jgi:hypothetical protein